MTSTQGETAGPAAAETPTLEPLTLIGDAPAGGCCGGACQAPVQDEKAPAQDEK